MHIANASDFDSQNQNKMDEQLLVRFYVKSVENKSDSLKAGRPIFHDVEYVEIRIPGSRDAIARPARPADIARFPKHYEAFKKRVEMPQEGTPLVEWPLITRSMADQLAFFNVKTVEQLVAMSDQNSTQFMGINGLKAKAKEWLDKSNSGSAQIAKLKQELASRDKVIEDLTAKVEMLMADHEQRSKRVTRKVTPKKE